MTVAARRDTRHGAAGWRSGGRPAAVQNLQHPTTIVSQRGWTFLPGERTKPMSEGNRQSWDEAIDALRRAAGEVRSAVGRPAEPGAEEDAAAARLKADVGRLEQSASDLRAKLSGSLEQQRAEVGAAFDRERA